MIKKLFNYLWPSCPHKWVEVLVDILVDYRGDKVGDYYVQKCEICGKMRQWKF